MTHYLDLTKTPGFGVMPDPGDTIVLTGVSVCSMPLSVKKREGELYADFARKYGIHFLFDDKKPEIGFYSVPWVEIGATDGEGGFIASVNDSFSLRDGGPMIYISPEKECFLITEDSSRFLSIASHWRNRLIPYDGVKLYTTKDLAKAEYNIIDFEKTPEYARHIAAFPPKPAVE